MGLVREPSGRNMMPGQEAERGIAMPELNIDTDKVCYLIVKAHEFHALVAPEGHYDGSDAVDDNFMAVLEDTEDNPIGVELSAFFAGLNVDQHTEILVLMLIGRGDYTVDEWDAAEAVAAGMRDERRPANLLAIPLLGDYLEEGLSLLGLSCGDFEMGHL